MPAPVGRTDDRTLSDQTIKPENLLQRRGHPQMTTLDTGMLASQGMGAQLERLREGAARFECVGGVPLAAVLKTGFEGLSQAGAIVLLVVEAANRRALYLASGRSIQVRNGVTGPVGTSGPYLALLTVEADAFGKSSARSATVMPVLRRDLLFPLADETERLVLTRPCRAYRESRPSRNRPARSPHDRRRSLRLHASMQGWQRLCCAALHCRSVLGHSRRSSAWSRPRTRYPGRARGCPGIGIRKVC